MSIELLPTLEKEVDTKKSGSNTSNESSKKGGMSLFDSLLSDAKKDTTTTLDTKQDKPASQNNTALPIKNKPVTSTKQTTESNVIPDKQEIKQLSDELVEIVVEKAKSIKDKSKLLEDESKVKEKVVELKENIKQSVKDKTQIIKESVDEIKKAVQGFKTETENSKNLEKNQETKEVAKDIKVDNKSEVKADNKEAVKKVVSEATAIIKQTVQEKTTEIKQSVNEIKQSVAKLTQESTTKTNIEDTKSEISSKEKHIIDKNVETIKVKVEEKTDQIDKAVKEIDEDVAKLTIDENKETKKKQVPEEHKDTKVTDKKTSSVLEIEVTDTKTIKRQIEEKAQEISEAVEDIDRTVSKVSFVSTDEIVKSIQDLKKEMQNPKVQVNTSNANLDQNTTLKTNEKSSVIASGLMQEQKNIKAQTSLQQVSDAKKNIEEKKNLSSVKQSANMLDLNPEEVSLENVGEKGESKAELFTKNNKEFNQNFFHQKSLNKAIIENEMQAQDMELKNQNKILNSSTESNGTQVSTPKETNVTVNVPQTVVETIQSKIIGAQQRMGSFMSDVARTMYLNYKPPFTAFKMSLNPANLGSISIVMRASKSDNSITVSMNMSNNSTMEAFVDNKATLQNAIQKQIGDGSNVSLNFGMENGSDSGEFSNFFGDDSSQSSNENHGETLSSQTEEVEEETNDSVSYM